MKANDGSKGKMVSRIKTCKLMKISKNFEETLTSNK